MIDVLLKRPGGTWRKRRIAANQYEFQMLVEGKVRNKKAQLFGEGFYYATKAEGQENLAQLDANMIDCDKEVMYGNIVLFHTTSGKYDDVSITMKEADEITGLWGIVKTK